LVVVVVVVVVDCERRQPRVFLGCLGSDSGAGLVTARGYLYFGREVMAFLGGTEQSDSRTGKVS
jgi:hypothetical protein